MRAEPEAEAAERKTKKVRVAVSIIIPVALLHFVTGPAYKGPYPEFVNGYLLDILIPFAFYFLLCSQDVTTPFLRPWITKALPVFAVGCLVEASQAFGVPILGETFDPLDLVMYAVGVLAAAGLDTLLCPRVFSFWLPRDAPLAE